VWWWQLVLRLADNVPRPLPQGPPRVAGGLFVPTARPVSACPGRLPATVSWVGGSPRIRHPLLRAALGSPAWFQATKQELPVALVLHHYLWGEDSSVISRANCPGLGVLKPWSDFFIIKLKCKTGLDLNDSTNPIVSLKVLEESNSLKHLR